MIFYNSIKGSSVRQAAFGTSSSQPSGSVCRVRYSICKTLTARIIAVKALDVYKRQEEYSVFMCGPQAMYNFLDGEIAKLGLRRKFVRRELFGMIKDPWNQPGYPEDIRGKTFKLKAVSYTHLDVYKRQVIDNIAI